MKNLFKSLMLVAVAAMGFTSCQKEELPTQTGAEKFTIDVIANLEETRSAFGEKSDNAYPSYWQGGEKVKAAILQTETYENQGDLIKTIVSDEATVTVSDAKTAQLTLVWDSISQTYGTMLIAVPSGSVTFEGSKWASAGMPVVVNVPTEQTPLENSVDPAAHILTATYEGSFSETIMPEFEHAVAYGKMTLKNFYGEGEIENVVVTIASKSYVLNPDYVVDNVFWFGCEANEAPESVTIAVNTKGDKSYTYTKTLDLTKGNGLRFRKGRVAEFGVDMDGVAAEEGAVVFAPTNILDTVSVKSDHIEFYRSYVGNGSPHSTNTTASLRIYMHSNDRGNNYINAGEYGCSGDGATEPKTAGEVNMRYNKDTYWGYHANANTSSTLSVSFVKGEYVIIATINGETWGYKGLPEGWVAPTNGGDVTPEPEPEPTQLAQPTILDATATADTATITWTAVAYASSYDVKVGETTKNVTTNTATFEGLTAETTYVVSVVAVGDGTNYTDSTAATTTVTTLAASTPEIPDDDAVTFTSCTYLENVYGMLKHYKFVSADGNNVIHVFMNSNNSGTATQYIPVGEYTNDSMNNTANNARYFNMNCDLGVSINDTKINGEIFANGISNASTNTMSVTEAANGGVHVIEFVIKGTTFRFNGTIQ